MTTTLTSDELLLLKTIRAEPGNDTPRLAYADFLDERDNKNLSDVEQAEMIRCSIKHWRMEREALSLPRVGDLSQEDFLAMGAARGRMSALLSSTHALRWMRPPAEWCAGAGTVTLPRFDGRWLNIGPVWHGGPVELRFRRGFVQSLTMSPTALLNLWTVLDGLQDEAVHPIGHVTFTSMIPDQFIIKLYKNTYLCLGEKVDMSKVDAIAGEPTPSQLTIIAARFPGITFRVDNQYRCVLPDGAVETGVTSGV